MQAPHSSVPPQPSEIVQQSAPSAAQVVGVHGADAPASPDADPGSRVLPTSLASSPLDPPGSVPPPHATSPPLAPAKSATKERREPFCFISTSIPRRGEQP